MTYAQAQRRWKIRYWRKLLEAHHGSVIDVARAAGVNRTYLHKLVHDYGLDGHARPPKLVRQPVRNSPGPRLLGSSKRFKPPGSGIGPGSGPGSVKVQRQMMRRKLRQQHAH